MIALAAVAGAHGIKGEVRLKLFADSADSLKQAKRLWVGGVERKLASLKTSGRMPIARFDAIADRSAAEALRGKLIEIDRADLPPLAEGEYYFADLIGLACFDDIGEAIGTVVAVENFGAGDVIEIEKPGGNRFMVPMNADAVPDWDEERIIIASDFVE